MNRGMLLAGAWLAATSAWGAVSWDEHQVIDGVRWTARATEHLECELGSDREDGRALPEGTSGRVEIPPEFKARRVTAVGRRAFAGMDGIVEVVVPEGVREIGEEAFAGCTGLERVSLPESLFEIHARAFAGCTGLRRLELPGGVFEVGAEAFAGCTGLGGLEIRPVLTNVAAVWRGASHNMDMKALRDCGWPVFWGRRAFAGCTALESVRSARGMEYVHHTLPKESGKATAYYFVPKGEAPDVFEGCPGIRDVELYTPLFKGRTIADLFPDAFAEIRRVVLVSIFLRYPINTSCEPLVGTIVMS